MFETRLNRILADEIIESAAAELSYIMEGDPAPRKRSGRRRRIDSLFAAPGVHHRDQAAQTREIAEPQKIDAPLSRLLAAAHKFLPRVKDENAHKVFADLIKKVEDGSASPDEKARFKRIVEKLGNLYAQAENKPQPPEPQNKPQPQLPEILAIMAKHYPKAAGPLNKAIERLKIDPNAQAGIVKWIGGTAIPSLQKRLEYLKQEDNVAKQLLDALKPWAAPAIQ